MSIINPPAFFGLASHQYAANRIRRLVGGLLHNIDGVATPTDLVVTPTAPASMSVSVAPGAGFVTGTAIAGQGVYMVENDAPATVGPLATVASGSRIDLVVVRVQDGAPDGGGDPANTAALQVVQGTAAASPALPTVPPSCLVLASVVINAGDTSITSPAIGNYNRIAGSPPSPVVVRRLGVAEQTPPTSGWMDIDLTNDWYTLPTRLNLGAGRWQCRADVWVTSSWDMQQFLVLQAVDQDGNVLNRARHALQNGFSSTRGIEWVGTLPPDGYFKLQAQRVSGGGTAASVKVGVAGEYSQVVAQRVL